MAALLRTLFAVLLAGSTSSAVVFNQLLPRNDEPGCPDLPTQMNFNLGKYAGSWHEHFKLIPAKSLHGTPLEYKCAFADINLDQNSTTGGKIRTKAEDMMTGISAEVTGEILTPDLNEPAKLMLRFSPGATLISYWVLATDYVRYAVVYSCSPNPVTPANFIENISVLTRQSGELMDAINYTIDKLMLAYFWDRQLHTLTSEQGSCGTMALSKKTFVSNPPSSLIGAL